MLSMTLSLFPGWEVNVDINITFLIDFHCVAHLASIECAIPLMSYSWMADYFQGQNTRNVILIFLPLGYTYS